MCRCHFDYLPGDAPIGSSPGNLGIQRLRRPRWSTLLLPLASRPGTHYWQHRVPAALAATRAMRYLRPDVVVADLNVVGGGLRLAELMGDLSPVNPAPDTIEALGDLCSRVVILRDKPKDLTAYARLCNELHALIIAQIGNAALREMTDLLYYRAARTWLIYLGNLDWFEEIQILYRECSEILLAMEIDDMRGVGNARRQFLYMTLTRISRYLVDV